MFELLFRLFTQSQYIRRVISWQVYPVLTVINPTRMRDFHSKELADAAILAGSLFLTKSENVSMIPWRYS
jgi:hypothetical protein